MSSNLLYAGAAIIVILMLLLLIQSYKATRLQVLSDKKFHILVDTEKGVIKADHDAIADELLDVKSKIIASKSGAVESCSRLTPLINQSIRNLAQFMNENPMNEEALCTLDLRSDIINQALLNSVDPEPDKRHTAYQTILEWEEHERDMPAHPVERLEYLVKNIDVVIKLLRGKVCNYGRIDLKKLYEILKKLNERICHPIQNQDKKLNTQKDVIYKSRSLNMIDVGTFESNESDSMETSIDGQEIRRRRIPTKESFGSIVNDSSSLNAGLNAGLNASFEDLAEVSLLGYRSPGHLISMIEEKDKLRYSTVEVNACMGKTVSDENLLNECSTEEKKLRNALDGDARDLLKCKDDCYDPANYYDFYEKLYNESNRGSTTPSAEEYLLS